MTTNSEPKLGIMQAIRNLRSISRWDEWSDSKLPFIFLAWFITVYKSPVSAVNLLALLKVLGFTAFFLAFGYVFNDWMDREADQHVGKIKQIQAFQPWKAFLLLVVLCLCSIFSLASWLVYPPVILIVLTCYFLAVSYSGTRLRFKERGQWGLFVASLSQRTLPCLLVFAIMDWWKASVIIFLFLTMVIGLRWMVTHQLDDLERDKQSQVKTFAAQNNKSFLKNYLVWMLNIELVLLIVLGMMLSYPPLLWVYLAYLILTITLSIVSKCTPWQMLQMPSSAYLVLADFYFIYWPIGSAILLSLRSIYGTVALTLLVLLQLDLMRQHFTDLKSFFFSQKLER
jgi:4-hydroxybenzoate polyprenyltransferase